MLIPDREQIPAQYKWRLTDIYNTLADWEDDYRLASAKIAELAKYKDQLGLSPQMLLAGLTLKDELGQILEKLYPYARLHQDENTADNTYQALTGKAQLLASKAGAAAAFMEPEILAMSPEKLASFRQQEPALEPYSYYLDKLAKKRPHILSPQEEVLLSKMSELTPTPAKVFTMLSGADMVFPTITDEQGQAAQLSEGRYASYLRSQNRTVRQTAFSGILGTYKQYRNTLAAALDGQIRQHVFFAKNRNYPSALQASLADNDIPVAVYDNLLRTVETQLAPLQRYIALKKKALGLSEIHTYDLYVPLVKEADFKIPYEEGLNLLRQALSPLGEEYLSRLNHGLSAGWLDVYENKGKKSGAYSWGVYDVHPFVLLNYNNQIHDVSTVAHEMGHALHSYYSQAYQPYCTSHYVIFTAETASTTNEILLIDHLLQHTQDKRKKLYLLNQYLENIRTTVYRQTMFAEFEKTIHEKSEQGETLTADLLESLYHRLNEKYFGADIVIDTELDMEWARIPHFYRNFYVYQYATGYSAATAFAAKLQTEGQPAQDAYINNFLKAGGKNSPITILQQAGVDMSTPQPIAITLQKFSTLLDELERLL